jgi:tetratricopeptide (TPR) repeat protein
MVVVASWLVGSTAFGQSADDLNRAAGALFEKGDFPAAARLLEVVLRLEPSARAHRNLALCYAKIPDHEEKAVLHMQAYLRARPDAADRAKAERLIAALDERIAQKGSFAVIESDPPGATVYADDTQAPLGETPLRTRLALGQRVLRFEKKGFETVRRPLEIALRQQHRVGGLDAGPARGRRRRPGGHRWRGRYH